MNKQQTTIEKRRALRRQIERLVSKPTRKPRPVREDRLMAWRMRELDRALDAALRNED